MELITAQKIFKALEEKRERVTNTYQKSMRYYNNKNDILWEHGGKGIEILDADGKKDGGIRRAKNRISNGFHRIITDQATQYTGGIVPSIDVDDRDLDDKILVALGDNFDRYFARLCNDAANAGTAWVHYWKTEKNEFKYAVINPTQITPIYDDLLEHTLIAVRRTYEKIDQETGDMLVCDEYWTDKEAYFFKRNKGEDYTQLVYDYKIPVYDDNLGEQLDNSNVLNHNFGRVPFIPFMNNQEGTANLPRYKGLIDVYDRVFAGFVNDIDDIQQVVLTLYNYGGEEASAEELLQKIKLDKVLKLDSLNPQDKSGLDTLTIDIPIEARNSLLDRTREAIFLQSQAVDPTKVEMGTNKSGVALKMLYSLLELKAAALESEFRPALAELVRAIMQHLNVSDADTRKIEQKWTRAAVKDAAETATIIAQLTDVTSKNTIAKNNPLVEDPQRELEELEKDKDSDMYSNPAAAAAIGTDKGDELSDGTTPPQPKEGE